MSYEIKGDLKVGRNLQLGSVSDAQKGNITADTGGLIWSTDNSRVEVTDGTVFSPLSASAVAVKLNSVSGVDTQALGNATGSGEIIFYVNEDINSNAAILTVPSGQSLNGVTNGTFSFSNYADGTQFRVDDSAPGEWVVSVAGASQQTVRPFGYAELTVQDIVSELGLSLNDAGNNYTINVDNDPGAGSPLALFSGRAQGMTFIPATAATFPDGYDLAFGATTESAFQIEQAGDYTVQFQSPNIRDATQNDGGLVPLAALIDSDGTTVVSVKAAPMQSPADSQFSQFDFENVTAGQYIQVGLTTADQDNSGGDTIDIAVTIDVDDAQAADINIMQHASVTVFRNDTTETVLAGMVQPSPLNRFSVSKTAVQGTTPNTYPSQEQLTWDVVNVDTAIGFSGAEYVIPEGSAGPWRFSLALETDAAGTLDGQSTLQIVVNGTEVARTGFATAGDNVGGAGSNDINYGNVDVEVDVQAGDVVGAYVSMINGIGITGNPTTSYFQGRQLPTSTIVNPNALTPVDLHVFSATRTTTLNKGLSAYTFAEDGNWTINDSAGLNSGGNITIQNSGRYRLYINRGDTLGSSAEINVNGVQQVFSSNVDAGADFTSQEIIVDLVAGDIVTFEELAAAQNLFNINCIVQQLAPQSVIAYSPGQVEATSLEFIQVELSTDTASTADNGGNRADFDVVTRSSSTALSLSNGKVTLEANKRYKISAQAYTSNG